jgi:hypothetical protein
MERLESLTEAVKGREPTLDEALELLLCLATAPYGVEPQMARTVLAQGAASGTEPAKTLPVYSANILAACYADAVRILGRCKG